MSECDLPDCDQPIETFDRTFPLPHDVAERVDFKEAMLCDEHHVAARIMAYTRPDHPYVDVGLYQEVTYYSRSLAAATLGLDAMEHVNQPDAGD